jgi:lipopolysaccharide transport system ATP-binding protein
MSYPVISVENLSKAYRLGQIGTGTLTNDLKVWWAKKRGLPNPLLKIGQTDHGNREGELLWALKDVSLQVEQGEVLGIIGRNGAGKSTLLKILSRVTAPTCGRLRVKGRIASLLEVGTGFHPELTGKENIYLNGAILGMSKEEVRRKFDEIVAFAEVEKFIDTPVKRYSSGMYVRLAFAVASHLEPEIMLVDEVLSVGDANFQKKCLDKLENVSKEGRTILFVSHNMGAISQLCKNGILLDSGKILGFENIDNIISKYLNSNLISEAEINLSDYKSRSGNGSSKFTFVGMYDQRGIPNTTFFIGDSIRLCLTIRSNPNVGNLRFGINAKDNRGRGIFHVADVDSNFRFDSPASEESLEIIFSDIHLYPGTYYLSAWIGNIAEETLDYLEDFISFTIEQGGMKLNRNLPLHAGIIYMTPEIKRMNLNNGN